MKSNQKPVPNGVPQRLIVFNACKGGVHPLQVCGQYCTMGSRQHGGVEDKHLDRLKKWTEENLM